MTNNTMTNYTYSDELYSDFHKDVYGFRPRGVLMQQWDSMTPAEKQEKWDSMGRTMEEDMKQQREGEAVAKQEFEQVVDKIKATCNCGFRKAVKFLVEGQGHRFDSFEVEHVLYMDYGMSFQDIDKINKTLFKNT